MKRSILKSHTFGTAHCKSSATVDDYVIEHCNQYGIEHYIITIWLSNGQVKSCQRMSKEGAAKVLELYGLRITIS